MIRHVRAKEQDRMLGKPHMKPFKEAVKSFAAVLLLKAGAASTVRAAAGANMCTAAAGRTRKTTIR